VEGALLEFAAAVRMDSRRPHVQPSGGHLTARALRVACLILLVAAASTASAEPPIVGAWNLVSYAWEDPATAASTLPWGEKPSGRLLFLPDGHTGVTITGQARQPAVRGEDGLVEKQARLCQTVTAYSGTYAIRGSTMTVRVEVASDPGMVGTDLAREVRIEGDLLTIRTAPMKSMSDGKMHVYALAWKRASK
jgi:hypothetical protein